MRDKLLNRFILDELDALLKLMPVVLMTGARQTGKTTLVEILCKERGYSYSTFDDILTLSAATSDPARWLA